MMKRRITTKIVGEAELMLTTLQLYIIVIFFTASEIGGNC
jgi:hypothetical protein